MESGKKYILGIYNDEDVLLKAVKTVRDSLTREQTRSFHAGSLIVNVVVLMVGILAVLGSAHDAGLARTSAREVLIAAVFVFYVLTPALNVVLITRLLRATPPGPTPD